MSAHLTIVGRLGGDPELKITANGKTIAKMSVVSNGRRKVGEQWEDVDTTWWSLAAFDRTAEAAVEQLHKGERVVIVGRVVERSWETPEGDKRSRMEVVADTVAKVCVLPRVAEQADPWAGAPTSDEAPF